ncbi:MAG: DUF11 domain-containing protein [Chloroflexota bacterium]|nr:MAG: DUF11 domain-containing protein [Chloroflexota bacterium]
MRKTMRVLFLSFLTISGIGLVLILTTRSVAVAASPVGSQSEYTGGFDIASAAVLESCCPPTTTVTGQLDPATSQVQVGRLFRDGVASTCSAKEFPGIFNPTGNYLYELFGPYENYGSQNACVVVTYKPCGANAHLVAYQNSYNPSNQSLNYLGDVGLSTSQPFSFTVPAGENFFLVAQSTTQLFGMCSFEFSISQVPCQTIPFIELGPTGFSGTLLQETSITRTLTITNHGLPDLNWTVSGLSASWISLDSSVGTVPADASSNVTLSLDATGLAAGVYTGTVEIASNDTVNPLVQVPVTITVEPSVDLAIAKGASPDPVFGGQPLTYTLSVTNNGYSEGTGIVVTDTLPSTAGYVSSEASQGICDFAGGTLSCAMGSFPISSTAVITIHVTAPMEGGSITNLASVSGNEIDPNLGNNTANIQTTVIVPGDIGVVISGDPNPVGAGQALTYTLTTGNYGDTDATGITLTNTLPPGVTFLNSTASQGTCTFAGGIVTCNLGSIHGSETAVVTVTVNAPATAGVMTNQAVVSAIEPDPNPDNNTASLDTTVLSLADLSLNKVDLSGPVLTGELVTYTLFVTNNGPSVATGILLTDTLPAETTYLASTASQGGCAHVGGSVTCDLGSLAAGSSAEVSIFITAPGKDITIENQALVAANEIDPNLGNNTASIETTVISLADLSLSKVEQADTVGAGGLLTYKLSVTNHGPSTATGVLLTNTLPVEAAYLASIVSQGSCAFTGGLVTCDLGSLAVGGFAEVTITANAPFEEITIRNRASVAASESDPNPANNTASHRTRVTGGSGYGVYIPIIQRSVTTANVSYREKDN